MAVSNDLSKGVLFYDDSHDLLCVNYTDSNSPYAGWWTYTGGTQNTCAPQSANNNVSVSTDYFRKPGGSKSYKHFVKYLGSGNNNGQWGRGEWGIIRPPDQTIQNAWRWAAMSTLIAPSHAFEERRYQIGFDHKESPDDLETPFWLGIWGYPGDGHDGPRYGISGRYVGDNTGRNFIDLGKVETGVWVDWALERNWTTGNDGFMRFYKNGVKVWERINQPNIPADGLVTRQEIDGRDVGDITQGENFAATNDDAQANWTLERNIVGSVMSLAIYRNGVKVWERLNLPVPSATRAPICRVQQGFYKWAWYSGNPEGPPAGGNPTGDLLMYTAEHRFGNNNATLADVSPGGSVTPIPPDPIPTGTIRINSGGKKNGNYDDDKYYSGGTPYSFTSNLDPIYNTERFGNFEYRIPLAAGDYEVKLHFAEMHHDAAGDRVFNVAIEGITVLQNFDIFVAAGGARKPIVKSFPVSVKDTNLNIKFTTVQDQAKISAIEVLPVEIDVSMYVKAVELRKKIVDGIERDVSVTIFNDDTEQVIEKKQDDDLRSILQRIIDGLRRD